MDAYSGLNHPNLIQPPHADFFLAVIEGKTVEVRRFPKTPKGLAQVANESLFRSQPENNRLQTRVPKILEIVERENEIIIISEDIIETPLSSEMEAGNAPVIGNTLANVARDIETNLHARPWATKAQQYSAARSVVSRLPAQIRPKNYDWDAVVLNNAEIFQVTVFSALEVLLINKKITNEIIPQVKELVNLLAGNVNGFKFRNVGHGTLHGRPALGNIGYDKNGLPTITAFEAATEYYIRFYNAASILGHLITRYPFSDGLKAAFEFLEAYKNALTAHERGLFEAHFLPILSQRLMGDLSDVVNVNLVPGDQGFDQYYLKVVEDIKELLNQFKPVEG